MQIPKKAHPYARYVASVLEAEGFLNLRLEDEVKKIVRNNRGRKKISFDISYFTATSIPHKEYVECKYKNPAKGAGATHEDVSKFILDLESCGIKQSHGMVVTNNGYLPGAIDYALLKGIRLYILPEQKRRGRRESLIEQYVNKYVNQYVKQYANLITRPITAMKTLKEQLRGDQALPKQFQRIV